MDKKLESFADKIISELRGINHKLTLLVRHPSENSKKSVGPETTTDQKNDRTSGDATGRSEHEPSPSQTEQSNDRWHYPCYWWRLAKRIPWKKILEPIGIAA